MDKLFTKAAWYDYSQSPMKMTEKYATVKLPQTYHAESAINASRKNATDDSDPAILAN